MAAGGFGGLSSALWSDRSQYGVVHQYRHGTVREQQFIPRQAMATAGLSLDGAWMCTASGDKVSSVFEVASRKCIFSVEHPGWAFSCALTKDGAKICTGCEDGFARLYDVAEGPEDQKPVKFEHFRGVTSIAFSADDGLMLTASTDKRARVFNLVPPAPPEPGAEGAEEPQRQLSPAVRPPSPDPFKNKRDDYPPPVLEMRHEDGVYSASFSADEQRIVTAAGAARYAGVVKLWDRETGAELNSYEVDDTATSASFSPDGATICASSKDKKARVFDVETGQELRGWVHTNWVLTARFSHSGKFLCTACHDGYARIFDVKSRAELQKFRHPGQVNSAMFTPDDTQLLTSCHDATVRMWGAIG